MASVLPDVRNAQIRVQAQPRHFGAGLGSQLGQIDLLRAQGLRAAAQAHSVAGNAYQNMGKSLMEIGYREQELEDKIGMDDMTNAGREWDLENRDAENNGILTLEGRETLDIDERVEERIEDLYEKFDPLGTERQPRQKQALIDDIIYRFKLNINEVKEAGKKKIDADNRKNHFNWVFQQWLHNPVDLQTMTFTGNHEDLIAQGAYALAGPDSDYISSFDKLQKARSMAWTARIRSIARDNPAAALQLLENTKTMLENSDYENTHKLLTGIKDGQDVQYWVTTFMQEEFPADAQVKGNPGVPDYLEDDVQIALDKAISDSSRQAEIAATYERDSTFDHLTTGTQRPIEFYAYFPPEESIAIFKMNQMSTEDFSTEDDPQTVAYLNSLSSTDRDEMRWEDLMKYAPQVTRQWFVDYAKVKASISLRKRRLTLSSGDDLASSTYDSLIMGAALSQTMKMTFVDDDPPDTLDRAEALRTSPGFKARRWIDIAREIKEWPGGISRELWTSLKKEKESLGGFLVEQASPEFILEAMALAQDKVALSLATPEQLQAFLAGNADQETFDMVMEAKAKADGPIRAEGETPGWVKDNIKVLESREYFADLSKDAIDTQLWIWGGVSEEERKDIHKRHDEAIAARGEYYGKTTSKEAETALRQIENTANAGYIYDEDDVESIIQTLKPTKERADEFRGKMEEKWDARRWENWGHFQDAARSQQLGSMQPIELYRWQQIIPEEMRPKAREMWEEVQDAKIQYIDGNLPEGSSSWIKAKADSMSVVDDRIDPKLSNYYYNNIAGDLVRYRRMYNINEWTQKDYEEFEVWYDKSSKVTLKDQETLIDLVPLPELRKTDSAREYTQAEIELGDTLLADINVSLSDDQQTRNFLTRWYDIQTPMPDDPDLALPYYQRAVQLVIDLDEQSINTDAEELPLPEPGLYFEEGGDLFLSTLAMWRPDAFQTAIAYLYPDGNVPATFNPIVEEHFGRTDFQEFYFESIRKYSDFSRLMNFESWKEVKKREFKMAERDDTSYP